MTLSLSGRHHPDHDVVSDLAVTHVAACDIGPLSRCTIGRGPTTERTNMQASLAILPKQAHVVVM